MTRKTKGGSGKAPPPDQQATFVPKADALPTNLSKRKASEDHPAAPAAKRNKLPPKTSQLANQKHIVANASAPSVVRKDHYVQLESVASKGSPDLKTVPPRSKHSMETLEFPSHMYPLPENLRAVVNIAEYVSELKREGPIEDTMPRFRRLVEDTYAPLRQSKIPLLPIQEPLEGDIGLTPLQKNDHLRRKMIQNRRSAGGTMKSMALSITEAYDRKKEEFYGDLFSMDSIKTIENIRSMVYSNVVMRAFLSSKDSSLTMEQLFKEAEARSDIYTTGLPKFEVVDPAYNADFLRAPWSLRKTERPCVKEGTCVGQRLIPDYPFREFLLPSETEHLKATGELPAKRSMCLMCIRFCYTSHVIMHTQTNSHNCPGAHIDPILPINRFVEKVGPGGYDPSYTLPATYKIDVLKPSQPCDVPNRIMGTIVSYNETAVSRSIFEVDRETKANVPGVKEHQVFSQ
jgi:hypothetical protein